MTDEQIVHLKRVLDHDRESVDLFRVACDLLSEVARLKEMDEARGRGLDAFEHGVSCNDNPWPHFGPEAHKGDAWDTGWYLGAGNKARAKVDRLRAFVELVANGCHSKTSLEGWACAVLSETASRT